MDQQQILRLYETQTHQSAAFYDLTSTESRNKSAEDLATFFLHIAHLTTPDLFIEAGAKDARVSVRARQRVPSARIVAFEANKHNFERFSVHPRLQGQDIEYLNLALSDKDGSVTFKVKARQGGRELSRVAGDNSLLARVDDSVEYEDMTVRTTSLDSHFGGDNFQSCCMWVDVEGAVKPVFQGAIATLKKTNFILVEVEDRVVWEGQWLRKDLASFLYGHGFVPIARDFQSRYQYNILYVKDEMIDLDFFRHALAFYHSRMRQA